MIGNVFMEMQRSSALRLLLCDLLSSCSAVEDVKPEAFDYTFRVWFADLHQHTHTQKRHWSSIRSAVHLLLYILS